MNMDRWESLVVMNIYRDIEVDCQEVAEKFSEAHSRKINENNLIYV